MIYFAPVDNSMQTVFETEKSKKIAVPPNEPDQSSAELIPLSFAQQRLWFFSQLERDSALYNIPTALRLSGDLNISALEKSLNVIIERHEALRTNFISDAGNPVQTIRSQAKLEISVFDLISRTPQQREDETEKLIMAESQKPFDLTSDLLLRATLIRLDSREHILILNMHHIVSDEWSLRVLFQELTALYQNFVGGKSCSLPELPIQYADYALWQRECLQGENLKREIDYWKNQLGENFSPLELPTDHPRPALQTYNGVIRSLALPRNILTSLNDLSRREGVTLFMSLLAAFKALLHRYTSQEQIAIGSPISGRNKIETENLIGFFVNTLVLRTNVSGEITFRELLARVREVTLGAYAHQELPFEKLIEELQPHRDAGNLSFIQVMFALHSSSESDLKLLGLEAKFLDVETKTAKFDLTFVIRENAEGLTLVLEYNTDLFEGETIERMLRQYGRLLEGIVENPEQKISRLNLWSEAERRQVLVDWNQTATDYPLDKC
ncbi:MAG: condensation domain-containing protein, partial [Verrucomicrobiota bacterium]